MNYILECSLAAALVAGLIGCASRPADAPSNAPASTSVCARQYAESATSAEQLQALLDRCGWDTEASIPALQKLNGLPAPSNLQPIALKRRVAGAQVVAVTLEADVFFNLMQAYPHPLAFSKLDQLAARISEGFEVTRIEITGYADPNERTEMPQWAVDRKRAEFMRKYFEARGIPPGRIIVTAAAPRHENTLEGRARDRSTAVKVVILRQNKT
ncbi:OmpA family protein [Variovorax paradoxus]|jgi:outer membrane protein OmpA-like peptidoglycan-associated protein|uniref:OmpA family protein n=1 Tax=Variovorax paradoxus TaxID=34073 RepID=A0A6I6HEY4_VARPD|nr:OmpA family protein [Variovorax paradoxus]QGW81934.1 OmpA family protein [Variovorax paradoxus]